MAHGYSARACGPPKRRVAMDEPTEHVESEGDRLIKQLVEKQLNTHVNLQEQLQCDQKFERRMEVGALSGGARGQTTWQQFRDLERWAELRSRGLSEDEMALLRGDKRRKMEEQVAEEWLADIRRRLEPQLESDLNQEARGASRHERELGAAVKPDSQETKLFQFAVACRPANEDLRPPNHPIHSLKALEQQLFGQPAPHKMRRRPAVLKAAPCSCVNVPGSKVSGWDVKCQHHVCKKQAVDRVYSCKPEELFTIRDGKIVKLDEVQIPVETPARDTTCRGKTFIVTDTSSFQLVDSGLQGRLSTEQIRNLPRFANYSAGEPSQVLYIKNLHRSMKEEDLVALLGHFEDEAGPKLTYRLMTGRMRGQAFVTFPSVERAAAALEAINGLLWRDQPLVVQYGRPSVT